MATLHFKGKSIVENHHLSVPYKTLVPDAKKSLTKKISLDDNLIIHGDNLEALKSLLPSHAGRIKCIYIDPPYNTGEEGWAYNDNVNSPMIKDWLGKAVDKDDLTRHDKWLCMMTPRLKLLRELMSDDGAIFVSIDDNEQHHLRMLMDEIFGETNLVAQFIVVRAEGGGLAEQYVKGHDYLTVFAKDITKFEPLRRPKEIRGKIITKNGKAYWIEEDWLRIEFGKYGTLLYEDIGKVKGQKKKDEIDAGIKAGEYVLIEKKKNSHIVGRLRLIEEDGSKFYSILKHLSAEGKEDLANLGLSDVFDYPKPVSLIRSLVLGTTFFLRDKSGIILDAFAGSGTTAQATLELNAEDKGKRRFILVQMPENTNIDSQAFKQGFRNVIDITAERVRRVIKGVKGAKDEKLKKGLGGSFSYFELGKAIDAEKMLKGKDLPSYIDLARYVFYTATGGEFVEKKVEKKKSFIGESKDYEVYLLYEPELKKLKELALDLAFAESLGKAGKKKRLVFAPVKYLDQEQLDRYAIEFCQLPFEIYRKGS